MNNLEIEYKYYADGVGLKEFNDFCSSLDPNQVFNTSGKDYFFYNAELPNNFVRIRETNNHNELTLKRKTTSDNFVRVEHNVPLKEDLKPAFRLCEELGYKHTSTLYKVASIFVYDYYIACYYVCFDSNLSEVGRFIELEIKEDSGISESESLLVLGVLEKQYAEIGIYKSTRVKESLFELFGGINK